MNVFGKIAVTLTLATLGMAARPAVATTYFLNNVAFSDGGVASGYFMYDAQMGVGNYDIVTTASLVNSTNPYVYPFANFEFTNENSTAVFPGTIPQALVLSTDSNVTPPNTTFYGLSLSFSQTLPTSGNDPLIAGTSIASGSGGFMYSGENSSSNERLTLPGASVTTDLSSPAPEPSQVGVLGLVGLGMGGLLLTARRRRRA